MPYDIPDSDNWRTEPHPVCLQYTDEDDADDDDRFYPSIRRPEHEEKISPEEECRLMEQQVEESKGFDIDFAKFRCVFNYQPFDLDRDDWIGEGTPIEFLDRMSRGALERYNEEHNTNYEFVKAIKANYHFSAGIMFYITFEGKLPSDDESKHFQSRLLILNLIADFISCELKPQKKVHSIEAPEKEDPKKPRLTLEPSNV